MSNSPLPAPRTSEDDGITSDDKIPYSRHRINLPPIPAVFEYSTKEGMKKLPRRSNEAMRSLCNVYHEHSSSKGFMVQVRAAISTCKQQFAVDNNPVRPWWLAVPQEMRPTVLGHIFAMPDSTRKLHLQKLKNSSWNVDSKALQAEFGIAACLRPNVLLELIEFSTVCQDWSVACDLIKAARGTRRSRPNTALLPIDVRKARTDFQPSMPTIQNAIEAPSTTADETAAAAAKRKMRHSPEVVIETNMKRRRYDDGSTSAAFDGDDLDGDGHDGGAHYGDDEAGMEDIDENGADAGNGGGEEGEEEDFANAGNGDASEDEAEKGGYSDWELEEARAALSPLPEDDSTFMFEKVIDDEHRPRSATSQAPVPTRNEAPIASKTPLSEILPASGLPPPLQSAPAPSSSSINKSLGDQAASAESLAETRTQSAEGSRKRSVARSPRKIIDITDTPTDDSTDYVAQVHNVASAYAPDTFETKDGIPIIPHILQQLHDIYPDKHIACLEPKAWLNDNAIRCVMQLLSSSVLQVLDSLVASPSMQTQPTSRNSSRLGSLDFNIVRSKGTPWSKKQQANAKEANARRISIIRRAFDSQQVYYSSHETPARGHSHVVAMVNAQNTHWLSLVFDVTAKRYMILDSIPGYIATEDAVALANSIIQAAFGNDNEGEAGTRELVRTARDAVEQIDGPAHGVADASQIFGWELQDAPRIAYQNNGYDCGVYAIINALTAVYAIKLELSLVNIDLWRVLFQALAFPSFVPDRSSLSTSPPPTSTSNTQNQSLRSLERVLHLERLLPDTVQPTTVDAAIERKRFLVAEHTAWRDMKGVYVEITAPRIYLTGILSVIEKDLKVQDQEVQGLLTHISSRKKNLDETITLNKEDVFEGTTFETEEIREMERLAERAIAAVESRLSKVQKERDSSKLRIIHLCATIKLLGCLDARVEALMMGAPKQIKELDKLLRTLDKDLQEQETRKAEELAHVQALRQKARHGMNMACT
jgi:hypothetical protein